LSVCQHTFNYPRDIVSYILADNG